MNETGRRPMRALLALAVTLSVAVPAAAQAGESRLESLDAAAADSGETYLDLARAFVPDLEADGMTWEGHSLNEDFASRFDLDTDWPDGLSISGVETVPVTSGGSRRLAVLYDFGPLSDVPQGPAILALYQLGQSVHLIDAVDVGLDRESSFSDPATLDLGGGVSALVVRSDHWNSNQSYRATSVMLASAKGLTPIDTIQTFSERLCGLSRTQEPTVTVDKAGKTPALRVEVRIRDEKVEESCDESPAPQPERTISVTYRPDERTGAYAPDSDALEVLARENEERF